MGIQRNKKAVSTIEMMVSFTIFLAFIIFLLTYLNPVKMPDISGALLDSAENGIENAAETDLIEMPVILDSATIKCFNIENPFTKGNETNVFIKDSKGKFVNFNLTDKNFTIQGTEDKMYYLYFSEDEQITTNKAPSPSCTTTFPPYKFSIPRLKKVYSYTLLTAFNSSYTNDAGYLSIKERFNLPITYNLGLRIYNSTSTIIEIMRQKPEKVIVKAREIPIQIIQGRETQYAHMSIQVW